MVDWLRDAVFYNIYPQSFKDTNSDGIGDLRGIIEKLDYIKEMGFNAVWLNPFYESPFRDAGYDVTDFYKVAPRYGTNEDFHELCKESHAKGIKVIVDLVAGHTSLECEWFKKSAFPEENEFTNRYVWTDSIWNLGDNESFISGYSDRDGCYHNNFFYCQPALNYGYYKPEKPWQLPMNHPDCIATRDALIGVMRYWLNLGADGFRVDMASSLVKNDPEKKGVIKLWQDIKEILNKEFAQCVLISEWSCPKEAIEAGFDIDFMIHFGSPAYTALFRHEQGTNQHEKWIGDSYFRRAGRGKLSAFTDIYLEQYHATREKGYISIPTGNHDINRISMLRDTEELKAVYAFIMTMPGIPFVYYGDEIGMRYIEGLNSKEGGFNRTGARTPMQWSKDRNFGFSDADEEALYICTDKGENPPTVEEQIKDPDSLLNFTKKLIALRKEHKALMADGEIEFIESRNGNYPMIYKRFCEDEVIYIFINPTNDAYQENGCGSGEILISNGDVRYNEEHICLGPVSCAVIKAR